jgi:hypothetical protein
MEITMRFPMPRLALGGLVALGLMVGGGLAFAQTIGQSGLSGNECWNAGQGPGGPSTGFLCANTLRGGTANAILSAVSGNFTIGTTSGNFTNLGTPNMAAMATGGNVLITAQPSAAVITMPPLPIPDGAIVGVCNVTNAAFSTNAVTLSANTGQTLAQTATLTTLAAGVCAREQWNQSQATWYRVQ